MDELALYDATRDELRNRLVGRFPVDFELESTVTAYAYWVCTVIRNHGEDWQGTVQEYVGLALRDAVLEAQAEKTEVELLRRELANCASSLVDIGAGWGRFGPLYAACGLEAVYVEPSDLGCRLLRRNNLTHSTRCLSQSLCFPDGAFQSAVIGWVLHQDAPDIPTPAILGEIARVIAPGGRLLCIEPLSGRFDAPKWRDLVELAGFEVEKLEAFFDSSASEKKSEQYACLTAVRGTG